VTFSLVLPDLLSLPEDCFRRNCLVILGSVDELTRVISRVAAKEVPAEELLPLVYHELRRLAHQKMAREAAGHTLQATALVHEAWMRVGGESRNWENRAHFFGAAAEAMRRILIDRVRSKRANRHGGTLERVNIDDVIIEAPVPSDQLVAIHEVLDRFAAHDPEKAELVKLHYFAGLQLGEAAEVLGISYATAKRHWIFARAWLYREITRPDAL
jgi:RNA polymerase sigma factor (TIGR02999 family)